MGRYNYTVTEEEMTPKSRSYFFTPKRTISEVEFNKFKELLKYNPKANIKEKVGVFLFIIPLIIVFDCILLFFKLLDSMFRPAIIQPMVKSGKNKIRSIFDEREYYKRLKMIINSSSSYAKFSSEYQQFVKEFENR